MRKRYLECGKIVSTHGIKGELKVQPWCDGPEFLCGFDTLYIPKGNALRSGAALDAVDWPGCAVKVEGGRTNKNMVLLKLRSVDTLDDAVTLRGRIVYIDREDVPPDEEGTFFIQDLIGLEVRDADTGKVWGTLSDVFSTGANDVYAIAAEDGKQLLAPAIREVVVETNVEGGFMRIRPLEGLFDDPD